MYVRKRRIGEIKAWFTMVMDSGTTDSTEALKVCVPNWCRILTCTGSISPITNGILLSRYIPYFMAKELTTTLVEKNQTIGKAVKRISASLKR
jgi:hypothetical protein